MTDTDKKKKNGLLAAIWESMTKTGGCCGSGDNCCCVSRPDKGNAKVKEKNDDLQAGNAPK